MAPTPNKSKQIYSVDHGGLKNFVTAHSTPMTIPAHVKNSAPTPKAMPGPKMTPAGSNRQTEKYGKAMRSAFKNTKTFGMPGM